MGLIISIGVLFLAPVLALITRAVYLMCKIITSECKLEKNESLKTVLCIGSGGHTTELLRLFKALDSKKYNPRMYIIADNDTNSEDKIHELEKAIEGKYEISRIPRSRNVHQSYISSVKTTLYSILLTIPVINSFKPDVIFCNGPGTCIPICLVSFLFRCLFILDCRIIFVESICRVLSLSLTGKILQFFADIVVVQWAPLKQVCFRAKYFGRLT